MFVFAASPLLFLCFMLKHAPCCKSFEPWLSICSCANPPCRCRFINGTVFWSFILYTEVYGRPYYCYLEYVYMQFENNKKKSSCKQSIVMLNLVLIDVICIVCFTVYCTCIMWDCKYVLCIVEFKFVYHQLCFELITPVFCTWDNFGECEPYISFKKDFFFLSSKTWITQNRQGFGTVHAMQEKWN